MRRRVPYTWRVGVDNAFGYLTRPDGRQHLVESRRFLSGTGLAVSLKDGSALVTAADGSSMWQPVLAERACELAGIPAPEIDGVAETQRRVDPFHVERHTSPEFNTIVSIATERHLPCSHALRAWLQRVWDQTFQGAYLEQPETFAASVLEQAALTGAGLCEAILAQLACDAMLDPADPRHQQMISDTGWRAALAEIPVRARGEALTLDRQRATRRQDVHASSAQLALV